jgi:uncharacterized cupin superfamily protein
MVDGSFCQEPARQPGSAAPDRANHSRDLGRRIERGWVCPHFALARFAGCVLRRGHRGNLDSGPLFWAADGEGICRRGRSRLLFSPEPGRDLSPRVKKINIKDIPEDSWTSPKGNFAGFGRSVSIALGRSETSTDLRERHPFDLEILRVAPGKAPYVYHSHSAQWELYHVASGKGVVRHDEGTTPIEAGDSFIFGPNEPHQLRNTGAEDLIVYVVADNPVGESGYYPDSKKWIVRSPERRLMRSEPLEYYDGEE